MENHILSIQAIDLLSLHLRSMSQGFHPIALICIVTILLKEVFDMQNSRYNFWNRSFTQCAPEIERLFESVSRSCGGPKAVDDSMVPGGLPDSTH